MQTELVAVKPVPNLRDLFEKMCGNRTLIVIGLPVVGYEEG